MPGPPPRRLLLIGVAAFAVTSLTIVVLVWLGIQIHGVPDKYFRERRAGTYYSGLLLLIAGVVAACVGRRTSEPSMRRFWRVAGIGFAYLALDDMLSIHEDIDRKLHRLVGWNRRHWLTDRLDDAIVAFYGVLAAWWAFRHRHVILALRSTSWLLGLGFVGYVVMVVVDALGTRPVLEESLKLLSETAIVVGVVAAYLDPDVPGRRSAVPSRRRSDFVPNR